MCFKFSTERVNLPSYGVRGRELPLVLLIPYFSLQRYTTPQRHGKFNTLITLAYIKRLYSKIANTK